jgi:hypothetical protein
VRRVKARRSDRTTASDSSSDFLSSASMESAPKNSRAKALRQACGVVTRSWKRLETDATAAKSLGARCASACVKISLGSSAIGLRLSCGSLCFLITSNAGPSFFLVVGGVAACSYSSILFFAVRSGVDGLGEMVSSGVGGLSRRSWGLGLTSCSSWSKAASAASAASCSAGVLAPSSLPGELRPESETPPMSRSWMPCWVDDAAVCGEAGSVESGVEAAGDSGCIK